MNTDHNLLGHPSFSHKLSIALYYYIPVIDPALCCLQWSRSVVATLWRNWRPSYITHNN